MAKVTNINIDEFIALLQKIKNEEEVQYCDMTVDEKNNGIQVRGIIPPKPEKKIGWTWDDIERLLD